MKKKSGNIGLNRIVHRLVSSKVYRPLPLALSRLESWKIVGSNHRQRTFVQICFRLLHRPVVCTLYHQAQSLDPSTRILHPESIQRFLIRFRRAKTTLLRNGSACRRSSISRILSKCLAYSACFAAGLSKICLWGNTTPIATGYRQITLWKDCSKLVVVSSRFDIHR